MMMDLHGVHAERRMRRGAGVDTGDVTTVTAPLDALHRAGCEECRDESLSAEAEAALEDGTYQEGRGVEGLTCRWYAATRIPWPLAVNSPVLGQLSWRRRMDLAPLVLLQGRRAR